MSKSKWIDFITGNIQSNDVSTILDKEDKNDITAIEAYQKSRFGIAKTDTTLLKEFFIDVRQLIESKNLERRYCGMVEVNTDIIEYLPRIVERLEKKGFKVIVLNDDTVITNTVTNVKSTIKSGITFILIFWDKHSVEEMIARNQKNNSTEDTSTVVDTSTGNATTVVDDVPEKNEADEAPEISGNKSKRKALNS